MRRWLAFLLTWVLVMMAAFSPGVVSFTGTNTYDRVTFAYDDDPDGAATGWRDRSGGVSKSQLIDFWLAAPTGRATGATESVLSFASQFWGQVSLSSD